MVARRRMNETRYTDCHSRGLPQGRENGCSAAGDKVQMVSVHNYTNNYSSTSISYLITLTYRTTTKLSLFSSDPTYWYSGKPSSSSSSHVPISVSPHGPAPQCSSDGRSEKLLPASHVAVLARLLTPGNGCSQPLLTTVRARRVLWRARRGRREVGRCSM